MQLNRQISAQGHFQSLTFLRMRRAHLHHLHHQGLLWESYLDPKSQVSTLLLILLLQYTIIIMEYLRIVYGTAVFQVQQVEDCPYHIP